MYDQGYRPPQNQPAGRRSNRRANSASSPVQAGYYSPPPQYAPQTQQPYYQQPASYDQHPASQGYVPPTPPKAVKGKKGGPKPPRKKFPLAAILASLVVLTILGAGGFYYRVHKDVTAYDRFFARAFTLMESTWAALRFRKPPSRCRLRLRPVKTAGMCS